MGKRSAPSSANGALMAKVKETGIDVPLFAKEAGYASVDAFLGESIRPDPDRIYRLLRRGEGGRV